MKRIYASLMLALMLAFNIQAANTAFVVANGAVTNVFQAPLVVSQITLANATATPSAIMFYDSPSNTNNFTLLSYITTQYVSQSITNTYVNYNGATNTVIYTGLVATSVTNAQTTNFYPTILSVVVPTNTTIVLDGTYRFNRGMFVTNGAATVTASLTYQQ